MNNAATVISESLRAQIRTRMSQVPADFPAEMVVSLARRLDALPLYLDRGGLYGLRVTGEVVSAAWDSTEAPTVETDQRIIDLSLTQGAKMQS